MKNEETTFGVKPICCRPAGWLFAFHRTYGDYRSHGDYMADEELRVADEELAAARRGSVLLLIGRVVVLGYIGLISPISPICLINPVASRARQQEVATKYVESTSKCNITKYFCKRLPLV